MPFLWVETTKLQTNYDLEPSPMCNSLLHEYKSKPYIEGAYLPASCNIILTIVKIFQFLHSTYCAIGQRALCRKENLIGHEYKTKNLKGSMTVEAAVIVPLLLLFFLHLGSFMEMLRLHGRLEYALWQTGRELAVYAAAEAEDNVPDMAVSYLYVNSRIQQILGREYLDDSPLTYGSLGLNYLASEYQEDENINIILTYQVSPPITCFPFPYFRMTSRYYGRAWTGYAVGEDEEQVRYVYVTEDGEVWHSRADCTYLKLSIYEAQTESVWMLRNTYGERYRACSRCERQPLGEIVYLTQEGNCYHTVRDCPALQRRIHAVKWQENMPCRPCSRCNGT